MRLERASHPLGGFHRNEFLSNCQVDNLRVARVFGEDRSIDVLRSVALRGFPPSFRSLRSLLKRVFLGTYQGSIGEKHLPGDLQEFEFRQNRRRAKFRTRFTAWPLRLALATPPLSHDRVIAGERLTKAA